METLRVVQGEVNELIRMVDDLILLVRTDSKQLQFEMREISLSDLLRSVGERFQERAKTKEIVFSVTLQDAVKVKGDPVYLKRVFNNLLDNAMKFTPEKGEVSLVLEALNNQGRVIVRDNGMGIEPEKQSKVFSRFYRTESARSHEGAGLGLNIAKAICDAHGAQMLLESGPGAGTQVVVLLPLFSQPQYLSLL